MHSWLLAGGHLAPKAREWSRCQHGVGWGFRSNSDRVHDLDLSGLSQVKNVAHDHHSSFLFLGHRRSCLWLWTRISITEGKRQRLTFHSRRTAPPPLNSGARPPWAIFCKRWQYPWLYCCCGPFLPPRSCWHFSSQLVRCVVKVCVLGGPLRVLPHPFQFWRLRYRHQLSLCSSHTFWLSSTAAITPISSKALNRSQACCSGSSLHSCSPLASL